jgi:hypothetical protein
MAHLGFVIVDLYISSNFMYLPSRFGKMVKKWSKVWPCQLHRGMEGQHNPMSSSCLDVEGPTWLQVGEFAKSTT